MMKWLALALLFCCAIESKAQYHFYFGNLHSHSNYSDGNKDSAATGYKTPGDDYNYVKGSFHMDFLGIADHNHYSANHNPGMRVANYAKGLFQADTANKDGTFVCMYGMEWGVISNGGHVVTYGVPQLVGWETGSGAWGPANNYGIYCAKSVYKDFWPIVNSYPGAFCTLAHPQWEDYTGLADTGTYNIVADNAVVGSAIRSGSATSSTTNYNDPAPGLYEDEYRQALSKGYHLGPVADQDNHYTCFGRTNHIRTVVLATELKRDSIMSAYRAMRFYASDDWNTEVNFTVNGSYMGSIISSVFNSAINIAVVDPSNNSGGADPISKIQVYYGIPGSGILPTALDSSMGSNTLSITHVTVPGETFYYYARITEADGDMIWTTPIWVTRSGVIPVTLTSFTGQQYGQQARLNWTVANELNNHHFEVEHSLDGRNFTLVGSVPGRGNAGTTASYELIDPTPANGINFYRLKQVDIDGHFTYSNTITVNFSNKVLNVVKVYPNPAGDMVNLSFYHDRMEDVTCRLYNDEGREVMRTNVSSIAGLNKLQMNTSLLAKGAYFVLISRPNERIGETSFIKN